MDYEYYMGFALEQAKKAFDQGEFPVGCVIVQGKKVIATGARLGTTQNKAFFNEIDHAEIRALKHLEKSNIEFCPEKSILFCTMEPCLMCFGAIILSGIKKIVYAYEDPMGGATKCDLEKLPSLYQQCSLEVISGVLRQKSLDFFYDFFNKEDNLYWKNSYLEEYTFDQKREKNSE
ncbi:nucleoside deaminase [Desulfobacula sp.]|uniref:nucleoside deaminase n=1 Tax=Desulfobacula sp. TaxID=2593537 RepID=UPI0039B901CA